jgi:hypothetical protein
LRRGLPPKVYVGGPPWRTGQSTTHQSAKERSMTDRKGKIQGEGDKESDRKYRERTTEFLKSEKGQEALRKAGKVSPEEERKLKQAEEKGKSRAKDEDPQIKHQSKH